jgi:hypothetical protein
MALLSELPAEDEVWLCDGHIERLDLALRLMSALTDPLPFPPRVRGTRRIEEALGACTQAILSLDAEAARRLLPAPPLPEPDQEEDEEVYSGDMNRPTPLSRLSPATRAMLSRPHQDLSDQEALERALGLAIQALPAGARALMLGGEPPAGQGWERAELEDWTDEELAKRPHQIHRWVLGEPTLHELRLRAQASPVAAWLSANS